MTRIEVNTHAEKIKEQVFHTFPYNQFIPNFQGPHADDCPGCIIEAEVQILVDKIAELSPVEDIIAKLEAEKLKNKTYMNDRRNAFKRVGAEGNTTMTVTQLVEIVVEERDNLNQILKTVTDDLDAVMNTLKGSRNG